ncbi:hypothetical protein [Amycolatopsis sp. PS_44_ISF1]|uniref:hypothetical protein n=1 Tax=Amycolatopsis sp. PS_44_ISF1 TaxID=2974917 RepID=UPI0028DE101B|nr:hypothetical protein [Amycolatopsis sp. PS_44_ISF1]MDT8911972.1 hypothetical protein [Amycolatopsis sp. PS_44_ISF1]
MRHARKATTAGVLLAAAGVVLTGCGNGGPDASAGAPSTPAAPTASSAATQPTPSSTPTGDSAPAQQSKAQLLAKVPGQQALVVAVPTGFEAITYDQSGHVGFWTDSPEGWHKDSTGSYPYTPGHHAPPGAKATGAVLSGMKHATFVLNGAFSEDSTGNAIAYTDGSSGWGIITAQPGGNLAPAGPTVDSRNSGVSHGLALTGGQLQTEDCNPDQPLAECGTSAVKKSWRWDGHQFVLAH